MGVGASMKEVEAYCAGDAVGDGKAFREKYDFVESEERKIGEGDAGTVYEARRGDEGFAVKVIDTTDMDPFAFQELRNEVHLLGAVDHANVVKLHDYYEDCAERKAFVVTDLLLGGEVLHRIAEMESYSEVDARRVVATVVDVLIHLHGMGVAHRDVQLENLVLRAAGDDAALKLCDFGFACHASNADLLKFRCGSPHYMAPELARREPPYGTAVDVWAVGVVAFILLAGYPPFDGDYEDEVLQSVQAGVVDFADAEFPDEVSEDARDFIVKCLAPDPAARLTAGEAILHPWFLKGSHEFASAHLARTLAGFEKHKAKLTGKRRLAASVAKLKTTLRVSRPSFADLAAPTMTPEMATSASAPTIAA